MSYFEDYTKDYHQQQVELSYVNGTSDQYIYNFEPASTTPSRAEMDEIAKRAEQLRLDAEYQREMQENFLKIAQEYSKYWSKDKTLPEQRDRLFYARRLASLYETLERQSEYWLGCPQKEYERLCDASERYAELVAILENKTPQEHYQKRWQCKEKHWRYWPHWSEN